MDFMNYDKKERKFILDLARRAIVGFLEDRKELEIDESEVPEEFKKIRACFVTLTKNGQLRGCIGNITPIGPLYKSVIANAVSAGFYDPRFVPVESGELEELEIEISILELPHKAVLDEIQEGDGVILEKGGRSAVFLPQVWEEFPSKEDFMRHLALKAGLSEDEWKNASFEVFGVEVIS